MTQPEASGGAKVRTRTIPWTWMDAWWLVFLAGLAALPPRHEIHKQLILIGFAGFQLFEVRLLAWLPRRGAALVVLVKIGLATLLIDHTGQVAINSSYFPIFYVPVVTAALLFETWGTIGWTAASAAAYLSYLWSALHYYRLDVTGRDELVLRVFFMFLLALIINRFVVESRRRAAALVENMRSLEQARLQARRAERLAALGQLSAGLAHEIRNPLAVIKGSAEMLEQQVAAPAAGGNALAAELAGYISSEVNRVNLLVTRFLDFARPLPLEKRPTALAPLLEQAIQDARQRYADSRVEVVTDFAPLPPLGLDATLAERAFANLASNAFEAMAGKGSLRVWTAASAAPPGVRIGFEDDGPGVPGELREQIFNPFFTTKRDGVGLGLAIVAKIVDQHGGSLRLAPSEESGGAKFEIFLPAE